MTVKPQRPLLVGVAVLGVGIWALDILNHLLGEWFSYTLLAGAFGAGVWWVQQKPAPIAPARIQGPVDATTVQKALVEAKQVITQLQVEVDDPQESARVTTVKPHVSLLQAQISQIATELNREEIRLLVMGAKGTGKTALLQQLSQGIAISPGQSVKLQEAPSFSGVTQTGLTAEITALQQAIAADLVLFLVTGDLTDSEFQTVRRLAQCKRTVLVFNKQDQYLPDERLAILQRIQERMQGFLVFGDLVAIAAAPNPIKVRQHQPEGSVKEWFEDQLPAIAPLIDRLNHILQQDSKQLVLASSFGSAMELKTQAKIVLNDVRRTRALPIVEQFQWMSAGTAFASPLPTLDLLATAAINVQMVLDLGAIYRQKFSLQQAQKVAANLGSLMLKLGLVELSTQVCAGFLKTNAITYIAGGCVQGVSAAYLTRVAGLSLIEYFQSQEPNLTLAEANPLAIERLGKILQTVFQQNQQVAFLQTFVNQVVDRLVTATPLSQLAAVPALTPTYAATALPVLERSAERLQPLPPLSRPEVAILEQNEAK